MVLSPHERSTVVKTVGPAADDSSDSEEEAAVATTPTIEDSPSAEFDEAAESAFLAEAKDRGEAVVPKPAAEVEEGNPKALPPLDELVKKIPPEVRDALEDLFRARFVSVKRFPKKALKS